MIPIPGIDHRAEREHMGKHDKGKKGKKDKPVEEETSTEEEATTEEAPKKEKGKKDKGKKAKAETPALTADELQEQVSQLSVALSAAEQALRSTKVHADKSRGGHAQMRGYIDGYLDAEDFADARSIAGIEPVEA